MKVALAWVDLDDPTDRAIALALARALRGLGHRVVLVGPLRPGGRARAELVEGFPVRRVGLRVLEAWPWAADLWAAAGLALLHARERPDVWHCHVFGRRHRAFSWAAALGRWRVLASLHLVLPDYLAAAGGRRAMGSLLRRAYHVTAPSGASLDQARALFPEIGARSCVVPYGAAAPRPGPRAPALPPGPFILCASRLAPYKGVDVLLMAFAGLLDRGHRLRLVLCGRDQLGGGLERFASSLGVGPRVTFAGEAAPEALGALLERCLFFVLPSRRENLPLALLEAMAAGKAVVACRAGGVPEAVTDGSDGLLAEPGDVEGLAAAMDRLARDPALRERLGSRARARSRAFDWGRSAASYAQLYAPGR